jgi:hypothetical protein
MAIVRAGDLDIDTDLPFQRRSWFVQRIGWVVMSLFVLGALAGLLGPGPLSRARVSVPNVLEVEYQRFTRYDDAETLTVRLAPSVSETSVVRLSLNRQYLDHSKVESVLPSPERVEAAADGAVFAFRIADPGRPVEIAFTMRPQKIGRVQARVRIEDGRGRETTFRQFAYP